MKVVLFADELLQTVGNDASELNLLVLLALNADSYLNGIQIAI